jgi:hypothetical protein
MSVLIFAESFRKPPLSQFRRAGDEDRYYKSHEPKNRGNAFSIASMAVVAGFVVLALDLLPG